jgi:hypothetical protein
MFVHVIKSLFCEAEAGEIISLAGESGQAQASLVGGAMHHNIRRARISWLDDQGSAKWVMDRIVDAVAEANRDTFRFRLDGFDEKLQVASYDEREQGHFDWHSDTGGGPLAARRKLTIVAQLSRRAATTAVSFSSTRRVSRSQPAATLETPSCSPALCCTGSHPSPGANATPSPAGCTGRTLPDPAHCRLLAYSAASMRPPEAGSTLTAQNLNSGILPNGSSLGLVSSLAAASTKANGMNTAPGGT